MSASSNILYVIGIIFVIIILSIMTLMNVALDDDIFKIIKECENELRKYNDHKVLDMDNLKKIKNKIGKKVYKNSSIITNNADILEYEPIYNTSFVKEPNAKALQLKEKREHLFSGSDDLNTPEGLCKFALEMYFNIQFKKIRPLWLTNPKTHRTLELDVHNPDVILYKNGKKWHGLGVEYQGPTHYKYPNWTGQTRKEFINGRERDELKRIQCNNRGVMLIEVPYTVPNGKIGLFLFNYLDKLGYKSVLKDA